MTLTFLILTIGICFSRWYVNNDMKELKPCPFCGCTELNGPHETDIGDCKPKVYIWIECTECPCGMEYFNVTLEEALKHWNTRA